MVSNNIDGETLKILKTRGLHWEVQCINKFQTIYGVHGIRGRLFEKMNSQEGSGEEKGTTTKWKGEKKPFLVVK